MVIRVMLVGTVGIRLVISVDVVNDLEVLQHDMRGRRQPEGRQRQHDDALQASHEGMELFRRRRDKPDFTAGPRPKAI